MNLFLINGYGLTEAPLTTVNTPDNAINKPMSIGKPVMFTEVRVLDDTYQDVTPGEIGELAIRGKNVTPGYWNKPEETAKSFHKDFFLTGDLARLDEDGDIYIVDRKKEMIITGGENVYLQRSNAYYLSTLSLNNVLSSVMTARNLESLLPLQ